MAATSSRAMLSLLEAMIPLMKMGCNDQAVLIYASHVVLPGAGTPVYSVPMRMATVAHAFEERNSSHPCVQKNGLSPIDLRVDGLGRILNDMGHPYAIVHQADRYPMLWARRHEQLRVQNETINTKPLGTYWDRHRCEK